MRSGVGSARSVDSAKGTRRRRWRVGIEAGMGAEIVHRGVSMTERWKVGGASV